LELLVKERLTGAIILVVLVVLLVPELLSGPKGPAATPPAPGAASPSSEEPPLRSYTINLGDEHSQSQTANGAADTSGPPQPSVAAQPTTTPDKDASPDSKNLSESSTWDSSPQTAQSAPPAPKEVKPTPAPPKPVVAPKPNPPTPSVVARTEPAPAPPQKPVHQPVPEKPAAKPAASESGGGWGVQLGVFASKENAERLALEVRTKGFKASVSPVTSGKRKLYRVRVGPAPDKSAAQELQTKLKAAGRPDGKVVPYS
jgi:DedD protein